LALPNWLNPKSRLPVERRGIMTRSVSQIVLSIIIIISGIYIAVYDSFWIIGLGLLILFTEIFWKKRETRNYLAVIHILAGIDVLILSVAAISNAEPGYFRTGATIRYYNETVFVLAAVITLAAGLASLVLSVLRLVRFNKETKYTGEKPEKEYDVLSAQKK
jgi:hypothetical protein